LKNYRINHFWIWNIEEHKREDVRTEGGCCFKSYHWATIYRDC
jgi:hypothetical protein